MAAADTSGAAPARPSPALAGISARHARRQLQVRARRILAPRPAQPPGEPEGACRICYAGADAGPLRAPCRCRGTMQYVHAECLRRWQRVAAESADHEACSVCGTWFATEPGSPGRVAAAAAAALAGELLRWGLSFAVSAAATQLGMMAQERVADLFAAAIYSGRYPLLQSEALDYGVDLISSCTSRVVGSGVAWFVADLLPDVVGVKLPFLGGTSLAHGLTVMVTEWYITVAHIGQASDDEVVRVLAATFPGQPELLTAELDAAQERVHASAAQMQRAPHAAPEHFAARNARRWAALGAAYCAEAAHWWVSGLILDRAAAYARETDSLVHAQLFNLGPSEGVLNACWVLVSNVAAGTSAAAVSWAAAEAADRAAAATGFHLPCVANGISCGDLLLEEAYREVHGFLAGVAALRENPLMRGILLGVPRTPWEWPDELSNSRNRIAQAVCSTGTLADWRPPPPEGGPPC
eukprot:TRINITY_DN2958_c2_g1_i1.p2 TRINITY_DN2958_c2_g1~~TRINITY_DN2958_c2_g1_i1.p2  ORF type:complete len:468 (+),score=105.76 TRINITY_DN2958_c2_g1_i1:76-1479(+)